MKPATRERGTDNPSILDFIFSKEVILINEIKKNFKKETSTQLNLKPLSAPDQSMLIKSKYFQY